MMHYSRLFILPISLSISISVVAPVLAATILVPDDQPTIQAGIDAASAGDLVLVRPGTYVENLRYRGRSIDVRSESGPAATIIDGSQPAHADSGSVVFMDGTGASIEGFTIRGGTGTRLPFLVGGGILVARGATVVGNWITENHVVSDTNVFGGGGIYVGFDATGTLVENNRIFDNSVVLVGGTGGYDGGGILDRGISTVITGNQIFLNSAFPNGNGGGYATIGIAGTLSFNVFACNQAGSGGGVIAAMSLENNTFVGNNPTALGDGAFTIRANIFTLNVQAFGFPCPVGGLGSCNNFFDNAVEDPSCFGAGTQNISVDPQFGLAGECSSSYCLAAGSPMLPENSPPGCGLIGARGLCETTAVDAEAPTSPDYASGPLVAYPNPFNPSTTIEFRLDRDSVVELEVVDVQGRVVGLIHRGFLAAGTHRIRWDGRDVDGAELASGAYVAVLRSSTARYSQKLLIMK